LKEKVYVALVKSFARAQTHTQRENTFKIIERGCFGTLSYS